MIHTGLEEGWIPNVGALLLSAKKHQDTTTNMSENWFQNNLLPNITRNSIIVMDKSCYHSRQMNKALYIANNKTQIQIYLLNGDIYFHKSYSKADLLETLLAFNAERKYDCDMRAKTLRYTVLWLPPYSIYLIQLNTSVKIQGKIGKYFTYNKCEYLRIDKEYVQKSINNVTEF